MHRVRPADVGDYPAFARLFPLLGVADALPSREQFADHMLPGVVIVEEDAVPAGYAFWRCYGPIAHVMHVVVAPQAQGRGLGRVLLDEVRLRAIASGSTHWYLTVKQDNAPARRLYERRGMAIEGEGWAVETSWKALDALPHGSVPAPVVVPPSDDAVMADHFGLPVRRLGVLRQIPDEVMYAVYEAGRPVGFGGFDPRYPRVLPFCVARIDVAHTLCQAFRRHARMDHVHVTVEGDRALFDALSTAGAQLRHAFFRMGAAL
jgi:GNAT superfamily N-acetyltransferase